MLTVTKDLLSLVLPFKALFLVVPVCYHSLILRESACIITDAIFFLFGALNKRMIVVSQGETVVCTTLAKSSLTSAGRMFSLGPPCSTPVGCNT